jgi:hypothetical protein
MRNSRTAQRTTGQGGQVFETLRGEAAERTEVRLNLVAPIIPGLTANRPDLVLMHRRPCAKGSRIDARARTVERRP